MIANKQFTPTRCSRCGRQMGQLGQAYVCPVCHRPETITA